MRAFLLCLLGSGLCATAAHAQLRIGVGPRLGGNLAMGAFSPFDQPAAAGYTYNRSALLAYQVGLAATLGRGHWAVQPALLLSQKGLRQTLAATYSLGGASLQENDQVDCRVNYLELPLNVVYSFGKAGEGFQFFAGPYVAVGVGGRASYSVALTSTDPADPVSYTAEGSQRFSFGSTFAEPDPNAQGDELDARARRFDAGLNAGVGYRRGPVQVQLGYGLGLLNAQPGYPASYQQPAATGYHRVVQLAATYYLPVGSR